MRPSRRICGTRHRSNASTTLYRCQTMFRCGRCAIRGGFGHGRPANPSIEGGGGRFTSIPSTVDVRLKPRAGLRQNPCNCAWVIVRSMRSCKGLIEYPPLVFEMITTRLVPEVTLFDQLERVEREIAHQQKIPCRNCESVGVTDRPS
jgi:hypothetical protein